MAKSDTINRFTYHAPRPEQVPKYESIRDNALKFALLIEELCPDSREKSVALTRLDEVVMFANASIARNE